MLDDSFRIRYKNIPFAVHEKINSQTNVDPHNHAELEILLITKNGSLVTVSGVTYPVKKGDLVFVNPMEVHSVSGERYSHKCICFDPSLIPDTQISAALKNESVRLTHVITEPYLNTLFEKAYAAHLEDKRFSALKITSYMSLMLAYLFENSFLQAPRPKNKNDMFCSAVLEYIALHYSEPLTSSNTAAALFYNQSYFCRAFKRNFAKSFSKYLNMYRVAVARMLLDSGDNSVTEVSQKCGFNTPSYFAKVFKNYVGVLPSEYK